MAVTVVVETGAGVIGANAYESVAATVTRLSDLNFTAFAGLASDDVRGAVLVRGTRSVDRSLRALSRGKAKVENQGLYYPRAGYYTLDDFVDEYAIPDDVILASALKAEFLALRDSSSNTYGAIPAGVTEIEFADGVRVKKSAGRLQVAALEDLQAEVVSLIDNLTAAPVIAAAVPWGA